MTLGTLIVGLIVLAIVILAVRTLYKAVKNGGTIQCLDCPDSARCHGRGKCATGPTKKQRAWLNGYAKRKQEKN